jgi:hypothetical protein
VCLRKRDKNCSEVSATGLNGRDWCGFWACIQSYHRRSGPLPAEVCGAQGYNTLDLDVSVTAVCTLKLRHVKCILMSCSDSSLPCALSIIRQMGPLVTKCVNSTSESQWLCLHEQRNPVGLLLTARSGTSKLCLDFCSVQIFILLDLKRHQTGLPYNWKMAGSSLYKATKVGEVTLLSPERCWLEASIIIITVTTTISIKKTFYRFE